jgi:hypothetical protein
VQKLRNWVIRKRREWGQNSIATFYEGDATWIDAEWVQKYG